MANSGESRHSAAVSLDHPRIIPLQAQKMEVIGRLASAMIHDLNNLLTVIQLNSALIESGGFEPDEVTAAAAKISEAAQRAADLTRKVLSFSRRTVAEPAPVELGELLDGLVRLLEPLVAKRVEIEIVPGPPRRWVRGDRGALEQAILNLVLNAVEAMPGGGRVSLAANPASSRAVPPSLPAGDYLVVSVTDGGEGIPPEDHERLFEPFFTKKSTGTGMGLAIVAQVARQHGGAVDFATELGRGTEFRIWLPAVSGPPSGVLPASPAEGATPLRGTILLVEDDAGIRQLTRQLLQSTGLRVLCAAEGEEALALWREHRDDIRLLFTDLVLPGSTSGRDIAIALLAERPDLPILYTSGLSSDWTDRSFFNGSNFLPKPFHPAELRRAIQAALAGG